MGARTIRENRNVLDRLLNPLKDMLTSDVAQAIADLQADATTQERLDDLA